MTHFAQTPNYRREIVHIAYLKARSKRHHTTVMSGIMALGPRQKQRKQSAPFHPSTPKSSSYSKIYQPQFHFLHDINDEHTSLRRCDPQPDQRQAHTP
jgi:hypothetical protein